MMSRVDVRVTPELKRLIDERRRETGVPINVYINRLIEADLTQWASKSRRKARPKSA